MKLVGNLTQEGCSFDAALDTTDIIYDPLKTVKENEVILSDGFMGLRVRGEFPVNIETLNISRIKNDAVQLWNGGLSVERLEVNHTTPLYTVIQIIPTFYKLLLRCTERLFT